MPAEVHVRHRAGTVLCNACYCCQKCLVPSNVPLHKEDTQRGDVRSQHPGSTLSCNPKAKRCHSNSYMHQVLCHHLSLAHEIPHPTAKKGASKAPSSAQSSFPIPASSLDLSRTADSLESQNKLCCNFLPNKRVWLLYHLEGMLRGLLEVSGLSHYSKQVSDQVSVSSQGLSIS